MTVPPRRLGVGAFSSEFLRSLNHHRPPARVVRHRLFRLHLWRPKWLRSGYTSGLPLGSELAGSPVDQTADDTPGPRDRSHAHGASHCRPNPLVIGWLNVQSLRNKVTSVSELITSRHYDVFVMTETWHHEGGDVCLRLACPPGHVILDAPRLTGRGGGVAIVYRSYYRGATIALPKASSFEFICNRFTGCSGQFAVLAVYRPGSDRPTPVFYDELCSALEVLVLQSCPIIIGGDFNIHVDDADDPDTRRLGDLLHSFDLLQHVNCPTHRASRTLDLVITNSEGPEVDIEVDPPSTISDHAVVSSVFSLPNSAPPERFRLTRNWRGVDRTLFSRAISESVIGHPPTGVDTDELFIIYDQTLRHLADQFAAPHFVRCRNDALSSWLDDECRQCRRRCRRLERLYRRTRSDEDRRAWTEATRAKFDLFRDKKNEFWQKRLQNDGRSSTQLWRSLSRILVRRRSNPGKSHSLTPDILADFFERKVADIRAAVEHEPLPLVEGTFLGTHLTSFIVPAPEDIRRLIMSSPTKSSSLDPIPTFLFKEIIDSLLPFVMTMVAASLEQACLPSSQKRSIVSPLLKKPTLDPNASASYRPVSNLFMSKTLERIVAEQLDAHLTTHRLLPKSQSAYRRHHSTETALLRVLSDAHEAADRRQLSILALLDLTAAFDCVDHNILLQRLELNFGVSGLALGWFRSFLLGRSQQVCVDDSLSTVRHVRWGVPQGSILGPILFALYIADLDRVICAHNLSSHFYADDTQLYVSCSPSNIAETSSRLARCVADVEHWLAINRLKLNAAKTEVICLGSRCQVVKVDIDCVDLGSAVVHPSTSVRDLGVILDSKLTMSDNIASTVRSCFFQLRQLRTVIASLTPDAATTMVHAFIHSRLDYCNSLMLGVSDYQLKRLQSVQNAAARLLTGVGRFDHISQALIDLHWLPVLSRIKYKVATLVYGCLHGMAPEYLVECCKPLSSIARKTGLRSSDTRKLHIPRTCSSYGDRSFSVAGPRIWNDLPPHIRDVDLSPWSFKKLLKTHLFSLATKAHL